MNRGGVLILLGTVLVLCVGILFHADGRLATPTTFGTQGAGQRALFETLEALSLPVGRSYEAPDLVAGGRTLWFLEPWYLCDPPDGSQAAPPDAAALSRFVEAGGTAVVFLAGTSMAGAPLWSVCPGLAGIPLPPRVNPADLKGSAHGSVLHPWWSVPLEQHLKTDFSPRERVLQVPRLARFSEPLGWTVRGELDGQPFLLEQTRGKGRLLVAADAAFLRNAWIDGGDGALVAADLVRALGPPLIDERQHGIRLSESTVRMFARLGALPAFAGIALLGLLWAWQRAALPPAHAEPEASVAPALEQFVASLARFYARTRDYAGLADRYRLLSLDRIRAHFGLAPEVPAARVVDQLRAQGRANPGRLELLEEGRAVSNRDEWLGAARGLDALVEEICR